jgi:hypothetical protein
MNHFWIGFISAVAVYFTIGFALGVWIVFTNLARFHGGGFQYKRMANHVLLVTLLWPMTIAEMWQ